MVVGEEVVVRSVVGDVVVDSAVEKVFVRSVVGEVLVGSCFSCSSCFGSVVGEQLVKGLLLVVGKEVLVRSVVGGVVVGSVVHEAAP